MRLSRATPVSFAYLDSLQRRRVSAACAFAHSSVCVRPRSSTLPFVPNSPPNVVESRSPLAIVPGGVAFVSEDLAGVIGGQVTVGSVLGFATGYSIKRIGQLLLIIIGAEVVALQLMSRRGWVDVKWNAIGNDLSPHVDAVGIDRFAHTMKYKVPFASSFSVGMYAGFRWS